MASESGQDFSQTLYEKLECYICKSGLRAGKPHWYRCTQDHRICQDCREVEEKKNCSCTKFIPLKYCEVIDALLSLDKMQFKCENLSRGCQESLDKENMIYHQTECIYRLVRCPSIHCESKIQFHELLDHMKPGCLLKDDHGLYNEYVYSYNVKSCDTGYRPIKITAENKIFFSTIKIKDGGLYQWIHFYGSPIEAKNYYYTVEYYNDTKTPKPTCSFSDQVVSIDETVDSIVENGNYFSITGKVLESKFLQEKPEKEKSTYKFRFKLSVKIRNLKEEVKDENVESGVSDVDE